MIDLRQTVNVRRLLAFLASLLAPPVLYLMAHGAVMFVFGGLLAEHHGHMPGIELFQVLFLGGGISGLAVAFIGVFFSFRFLLAQAVGTGRGSAVAAALLSIALLLVAGIRSHRELAAQTPSRPSPAQRVMRRYFPPSDLY